MHNKQSGWNHENHLNNSPPCGTWLRTQSHPGRDKRRNKPTKNKPKRTNHYGIGGNIVYTFYLTIQASALGLISLMFNFPEFDIEELILNLHETIKLFFEHDPLTFIIFIILRLLIVYGTIFFMEIALAILADGGNLKDAFDFKRIKNTISTIGWKEYAADYTKIIASVIILVFINGLFKSTGWLSIIIGVITDMLAFLVEYRGIGMIYKEYKEQKQEKIIKKSSVQEDTQK